GRRVAVLARDELLAVLVHVLERAQLLARVDQIARRRLRMRVRARNDPRGHATTARDQAAGLIRRRSARVLHDRVAQLPREHERVRCVRTSLRLCAYAPPAIAGMTMTSLPSGTGAS